MLRTALNFRIYVLDFDPEFYVLGSALLSYVTMHYSLISVPCENCPAITK